MEYGSIVWLGCGALAVMVACWAWATRKKEEPVCEKNMESTVVDFKISFWGAKTGCHGTFRDGSIEKNGVLINAEEGDFKKGDVIRGIVRGMKDGLWQVEAIKLSYLEKGKVIALAKETENWSCLYPNERGFACIGRIETKQSLRPNKKYAVSKKADGVFNLV